MGTDEDRDDGVEDLVGQQQAEGQDGHHESGHALLNNPQLGMVVRLLVRQPDGRRAE